MTQTASEDQNIQQTIPPARFQTGTEYDILIRLRDFLRARMALAILAGLFAAAITLLTALWSFRNETCVPLYAGFVEWDPGFGEVSTRCVDGKSPCQCEVQITPADPASVLVDPVTIAGEESLSEHFRARLDSFQRYVRDFLRLNNTTDIAGVVRLVSVLMAGLISLLVYRALLVADHQVRLRRAQFTEMDAQRRTLPHLLSALLIVFPVCVLTYITLSALSLLMADMFEGLALRTGGAILLAVIFVGLVGFIVSYVMSVLSTHHLLALIIVVFVVGMTAAFALGGIVERDDGPKQWWQTALSTLGEEPGTDVQFSAVLAAMFILLHVLWLDIAPFLRAALNNSEWSPDWPLVDRLVRAVARWRGAPVDFFRATRAGYYLAALGLLSVGIFPLVNGDSRSIYFISLTLHTGAGMVAMAVYWLGGMGLVTLRLRHEVFEWRFVALSVAAFIGIVAGAVLLAIGSINMTAVELLGFAMAGVWLYAAINALMEYSNLNTYKNRRQSPLGDYPSHPWTKRYIRSQQRVIRWLQR